MVRFAIVTVFLISSLTIFAIPSPSEVIGTQGKSLLARQRTATAPPPPPCVRKSPPPSEAETEARFDAFVQAFVGPNKNITLAFTYIANDYIVRLQNRLFAQNFPIS
jgi:hypothetical protein